MDARGMEHQPRPVTELNCRLPCAAHGVDAAFTNGGNNNVIDIVAQLAR